MPPGAQQAQYALGLSRNKRKCFARLGLVASKGWELAHLREDSKSPRANSAYSAPGFPAGETSGSQDSDSPNRLEAVFVDGEGRCYFVRIASIFVNYFAPKNDVVLRDANDPGPWPDLRPKLFEGATIKA